jgi:hypothetical protein
MITRLKNLETDAWVRPDKSWVTIPFS